MLINGIKLWFYMYHSNRVITSPHLSCLLDSVLASWVPLTSSWQCKKRYGNSFSSHGTLCAGSPPDTSHLHGDGCQGNSGGGLVCQEEMGQWVLAGVVSGGHGCGDPSAPSLYTRVSRFRSWIDEVIEARVEEPHANAPGTHEEHGHSGGKDKYLHVHDKFKHTHDQLETNEITDNRETHARHSHNNQHDNTHTKKTHSHLDRDFHTNTHILV